MAFTTIVTSLWTVTLLFFVIKSSTAALLSDYKTLTTNLFANYNKGLRPAANDSYPTGVYVGLYLSSVQELDDIEQKLTFSAFFVISWTDDDLVWDPASNSNITYFSYTQNNVWLPDFTILNSVDTINQFGYDNNYLRIANDGRIMWMPGGVFRTSCAIDVTFYPFDTQTCEIIFCSLTSSEDEIYLHKFDKNGSSVYLNMYEASGTWSLEELTSTERYESHLNARKVIFTLKLKRLKMYYVVSIIVPVIFLTFTSTLVFSLPADSGEKMGTSITVLLAFAVYLTIVSDMMPDTSLNVSMLACFLTMLLCQTAVGVLLTAWILNLHFRDDERTPGRRMRRIAIIMQKVMMKRPWKETAVAPENEPERNTVIIYNTSVNAEKTPRVNMDNEDSTDDVTEMTWKELSFTYDRFLFHLFTTLLLVVSVVFIVTLSVGGQA